MHYDQMAALVATLLLVAATPAQAKTHRSQPARHEFVRTHPCPSTGRARLPCSGYVIDHARPLCAGGADDPSNMQRQTTPESKAKDKIERNQCKSIQHFSDER